MIINMASGTKDQPHLQIIINLTDKIKTAIENNEFTIGIFLDNFVKSV